LVDVQDTLGARQAGLQPNNIVWTAGPIFALRPDEEMGKRALAPLASSRARGSRGTIAMRAKRRY